MAEVTVLHERWLATGEERHAAVDRKLDTVTALVRDHVARLAARMAARFGQMETRIAQVLAAIANLKATRNP